MDKYFNHTTNTLNYMSTANYMAVVPNSHFWTDLNQILTELDYYYEYEKRKKLPENPYVHYGENEISKEFLLIGLNNCIKNGYKLKRFIEPTGGFEAPRFVTITQMIEWIKERKFDTLQDYHTLEDYIRNTIANGFNLTNGMKMNRRDVYRYLDEERNYQDARWDTRKAVDDIPDEEKPVAEWINYMEYHLSKAKERVYHLKTDEALAELRKVTALGVRAMEIHGCPERMTGKILNPFDIDPRTYKPYDNKDCYDGKK